MNKLPGKKKGNSGNRRLSDYLTDNDMHDLIDILLQRALEGNMAALKILMDRVMPAVKPVSDKKIDSRSMSHALPSDDFETNKSYLELLSLAEDIKAKEIVNKEIIELKSQ